jgi:UDP-N-acetylmuramate--L-alanine ligase
VRKREEIGAEFSHRDDLGGKKSFFLVGIGGAGMSALARMLKHRGFVVRGTDSTPSIETERLWSEGIEVHIGHSGDQIQLEDALILTDAIDLSRSPEFTRGRELGIPIVRRSQALGWLLKDRKVIAVTGTHGKTTTTGMLGFGLVAAGADPLVVVGANIAQFGGPVREGDGEFAVVEACEAYDSFHDLDPYIVLLTNLELDHIDFHGNYENLRASVLRFVNKVPSHGCLIYCESDPGAAEIAELASCRTVGYTIADYGRVMETHPSILIASPSQKGNHNLLNAAGALVAAEQIGITSIAMFKGIIDFRGAERRQQVLLGGGASLNFDGKSLHGPKSGVPRRYFVVIDDYAHHPTEVRESLIAIKAGYRNRIPEEVIEKSGGKWKQIPGRLIVVFQPHLYSRTAALLDEFADALSVADEVVITDIYPAREDPIPGISSARIAEKITKPVHYIPSRHLLPTQVAALLNEGDVVVGMGAGNISEFAPALVKELDRIYDLTPVDTKTPGLVPNPRPLKVAVLYGGESAEREVSIHSGRAVFAALKRLGHDCKLVDMTELLLKSADLSTFIGPDRPDLAFLAVHGTGAEDGALQGLLELLHIPYTGSGIQASAIAMDKALTKQILEQNGVRVPKGALLSEPEPPFDIHPPLIVKPNAQGSTVGLSFVENQNQLCPALLNAFQYDDEVLVEEWIKGIEISTPVLIDKALLPVEIAPDNGKYDFESKYTPGATNEIVPARLPQHLLEESQQIALKAHRALRCEGATRTDMIVRGEEIFVLEINTLPGMTGTSLLPNSAAAMGITFDQLCQTLVEDALHRHAKKA